MSVRFSVIVPAYNEAKYLPRLLDSIGVAGAAFGGGAIEIVVSDNVSTDATAAIAEAAGCRVAKIEKRSIAAARNGGANIASGEIFCFIDADSALHPETFNRINEAVRNPKIVGGATGVYLERMSPGLFLAYCAMYPIMLLSGLDTGVVFCRREDFEAIGGYNEDMLLAEDVDFLLALKRRGSAKGQKLARLDGVKALGCTRKFDEHGDWHYFTLFWRVIPEIFRILFGSRTFKDVPPPEITDYWYQPNR